MAKKVVDELGETLAAISNAPEAATPEPAAGPPQSGVRYRVTTVSSSAVPRRVGLTLALVGEAGSEPVRTGALGAWSSCTKVTPSSLQREVLPAASVAVAKKVVEELGGTDTATANAPAVATLVPALGPEQSEVQ
jgi:hypothetical protein